MSKERQNLSIDLDGIGHAISDNKLIVPVYQRSYAWEEKHVNELFSDLFSAIRNSEDEYFIGSVVISAGNNKKEVVDGQQRLATISILIAAIRDYFFENDDKERAEDLQRQYLSDRDRRSQEIIPSLTLNSNDHNYFYNTIVLMPNGKDRYIKPTRESHDRIRKAYLTAKASINNFIKVSNNPSTALLDLLDFIDKHLKIIWVTVPDHANAFTIFETLNDRGLELAISDLLKNFLYGQAEDRLAEVQSNWTEMYSLLENTENEDLIVTFIRHYWSSIYGLTRERELYNEIKKKITSRQRAVDLATNLARSSKTYVALIDTNQSFWNDFSDEAKNQMAYLNMFGMVQLRPLLLAIFSKFSKRDIEKTLKLLVSASVRFLIHGGLGGGALETQYSERAKEINCGEITSSEELLKKMQKAIPTDAQFEESFATASVSKQYLARYYLMILESYSKTKGKPELIPNADTSAVNLEHVLPRNPDVSWKVDEESHKLLYNRLGNLAIMSSKLNSEIGNISFPTKKKYYKESDFLLTREIAKEKGWGDKEIVERQHRLAKLAIKAWPLK